MDGSATRTWWSEMRAIAARYGRGAASDAAEDLAQDLAIAALEARDPADRPAAWLQRVGRNAVIDGWRAARRRRELAPALPPPGAAAADPEAVLLARERRGSVRRALLALPRAQRRAALLRFHCGLPFEAIAERLGTETATARTRVHRALANLRGRVQGLRVLFVGWTGAGAPAAALGLAVIAAGPPLAPPPVPLVVVAQAATGPARVRAARPPEPSPPAAPTPAAPPPPPSRASVPHRAPASKVAVEQVPARQVFVFDPDSITADTTGPDGEPIRVDLPAPQPSLIEIRRHFMPEMLKALEEL